MGVDLAYITQRQQELEAAQAARGMGGVPYWNPDVGSSRVRLCPPWGQHVRSFERSIEMHFGVGPEEMVFTCPGAGCPICAHVAALRATGDPSDAELATRMGKKKRYYSNVVDLQDPVWTAKDYQEYKQGNATDEPSWTIGQTKVQVWGYGAMIYSQLINLFAQLNQDLTDLQSGYDLIVTKMGAKLNTKYTVIPAPPSKPLAVVGELTLHNLEALNAPRKHEDMVAALSGVAAPPGLPPAHSGAAGAMTPPPALPPAQVAPPAPLPPPAQLPPAAPKAAPPAPQPPKAAAPPKAPKPPAQVQAAAPPPQEEAPPCYKDTTTFSEEDPECIGGTTGDGQPMDKCPFFQSCGEHAGKLVAAPKGRRRGAKVDAPAPANSTPSTEQADDLEAQMQAALTSAGA